MSGNQRHEWHTITSQRIISGNRVHIPKTERERRDIDVGDLLDVRIKNGSGDADPIEIDEAPVRSAYRISIPVSSMKIRGLDEGDIVDVEYRKTGKHYR